MFERGKIWETGKCLSQAKVEGRGPKAPMEGDENGSPKVARKFSLPNKHSGVPIRLEDAASREIGSVESLFGKVKTTLPFIALTDFG
jgi:hypothetical protein